MKSSPSSFADVAVPFPLFQTFTYSVPEPIRNGLTPGCRVLVPFGNRHLIGLATKVHHESRLGKVKPVRQILDREPLLSPAMLKLGLWMASYYLAPPGEALRVMFPPGLLTRKVTLDQDGRLQKVWPAQRRLAVVEITSAAAKLTERQGEVLELLRKRTLPVLVQPFLREAGCSQSVLAGLTSRGVIRIEAVEMYRSPLDSVRDLPAGDETFAELRPESNLEKD